MTGWKWVRMIIPRRPKRSGEGRSVLIAVHPDSTFTWHAADAGAIWKIGKAGDPDVVQELIPVVAGDWRMVRCERDVEIRRVA